MLFVYHGGTMRVPSWWRCWLLLSVLVAGVVRGEYVCLLRLTLFEFFVVSLFFISVFVATRLVCCTGEFTPCAGVDGPDARGGGAGEAPGNARRWGGDPGPPSEFLVNSIFTWFFSQSPPHPLAPQLVYTRQPQRYGEQQARIFIFAALTWVGYTASDRTSSLSQEGGPTLISWFSFLPYLL